MAVKEGDHVFFDGLVRMVLDGWAYIALVAVLIAFVLVVIRIVRQRRRGR